jgi:quinol monooxygenase YgiN
MNLAASSFEEHAHNGLSNRGQVPWSSSFVSCRDWRPVRFYENWTSREALDRHAASAHIQAFGARAPELLEQPARIVTYTRIT